MNHQATNKLDNTNARVVEMERKIVSICSFSLQVTYNSTTSLCLLQNDIRSVDMSEKGNYKELFKFLMEEWFTVLQQKGCKFKETWLGEGLLHFFAYLTLIAIYGIILRFLRVFILLVLKLLSSLVMIFSRDDPKWPCYKTYVSIDDLTDTYSIDYGYDDIVVRHV